VEPGGPFDKPRLYAHRAHSLIMEGTPYPPSFGERPVVMADVHGSLLQEWEETSFYWREKKYTILMQFIMKCIDIFPQHYLDQSSSLELNQRDNWVLGHLSYKGPSSQIVHSVWPSDQH